MFLFFLFSSSPKHRTDFSSNPFLSEEERHKWSTPPVKFLPRAHRQGRQFALTGAEKNYSSSLSGEWGAVGRETCMQSQDESGSRAVEESPVAGASDEDESRVLREVTLGSDASAAAQRMMPPCGHAQNTSPVTIQPSTWFQERILLLSTLHKGGMNIVLC